MPTTSRRTNLLVLASAVFGVLGFSTAIIALSAVLLQEPSTTTAPAPTTPRRAEISSADGADRVGLYRATAPAVVTIINEGAASAEAGTPSGSQGSGFVADADGRIVTNAHVVSGAKKLWVSISEDRRELPAKLVALDAASDLAVVKVDMPDHAPGPLALGTLEQVQVGDPVLAIGSPFGLERSLSSGVVSAVGRSIQSPDGFSIPNAIQTDAPINHGNSGGPLLNERGQVIGVNTQIADSGVDGNVGIGFAVPVSLVREILARAEKDQDVARTGWLGVSGSDLFPDLAKAAGLDVDSGALLSTVTPGGPADKAGLAAGRRELKLDRRSFRVDGDVVIEAGGQPITTFTDLQEVVTSHGPGDKLSLVVMRGGKRVPVTVTLGERPAG